ncbi:MAG: carboxypeptidase-like regulatory domain-containing protein [Tannerella sp.]|jgi:TonB-dependent receptor|nr:carboxypeptidase-like regulatory domain-containing protein [Tannerella sp.]
MCKIPFKLILILIVLQYVQLADVRLFGQFDFKGKSLTVKNLIDTIEKKTDVVFLYNDKDVDLSRKISFTENYSELQQLLGQMFKNSSNTYKIDGKQIYIIRGRKQPEEKLQPSEKKIKISGVVIDNDGPMIGVNIRIHGTGTGTATDDEGHFEMDGVDPEAMLEISYIGYETLKIQAKNSIDKEIIMKQQVNQLKDIVVTAQAIGQKNAIQKQINSNTIKNVISAEKLQQNPDVNTIEAIGRLPGIAVNRSGGEGAAFLLRGLDQSYSTVLINGEPFPVALNVISTYSLQGVEVYKTLTANQEGDAVAGSVDLTLREIPKGLHYNLLAESGYNALNDDYANYNFVGQISNRFLDDKFGFFLSLNADRVNRSTSLMSVGYNTNYTTNQNDPFYISSINFNINKRINYKQSAVLSLDYRVTDSTIIYYQSFLSASNSYLSTQAKSFNTEGSLATVPIFINISEVPYSRNYGVTNNLSGRTKLSFLNSTLNYGISYSYSKTKTPGTRSWFYTSETRADGLYRDSLKVFSPAQIAGDFDKILRNLSGTKLESMSYDRTEGENWSITPRIDYEIPFKIKDGFINGKVRIGAKYRFSKNIRDRTAAVGYASNNAIFGDFIREKYNWPSGIVELVVAGQENNFLGGDYIFGDTYSFNRNNQVFDAWRQHGKEKYLTGTSGGLSDDPKYTGFIYNLGPSLMSDLNDKHQYTATYIMPEINIGEWLMFIPGFRFEYMRSDMSAFKGNEVTRSYSVFENMASAFGLKDTTAIRKDRFLLPMLHVRVKPTQWFYTHFSYTHTIRRPSSGVSPYEYYNAQDPSNYSYEAGNPELKTELWKSYDLQFTFHSKRLGLFSITGFNKTVKDKLWSRIYKRIPGDPIPHSVFNDNNLVNITIHENHPYDIVLRGIEVEWQTSFGYLPKPLSYLTLSVNYTYTHGKSPNPYTSLYKYKPEDSRYELTGRKDSVVTEPMTGMPEHMVNMTLGVEIKSFKSYLSYQFTSNKIQTTHPNDLRLYIINEPYSRLDFNASYGFELKNKGLLEILFKMANITNSEDRIRYREEKRPITVEQYGITADIGIRYKY